MFKPGFKPVTPAVDFPKLERELLEHWYKRGIVKKYLGKNKTSKQKYSFLDGPITANNPMGVHHAWGRTYKDLWQRFWNMRGVRQRFQNGFDEQGLWVEVEVEKELGLRSKKDIENLVPGDKFKSLEKFVNLCKARVKKYSAIQTEQSKRLGYFMDWDSSYHTSSDENNYAIWNYLKVVYKKGWLYKGRDTVPWCPRCGTAISQHEILTEEYQGIVHKAVYVKYRLLNSDENLLVWTTTPWTLPSNVAIALDPDLTYRVWQNTKTKEKIFFVSSTRDIAQEIFIGAMFGGEWKDVKDYKGSELVGRPYKGLFDDLPAVKEALGLKRHKVVVADSKILTINVEEGTGLVHISPGAGSEDFKLGVKEGLPVIASINEEAIYLDGFGWLKGLTTQEATPKIIEELDKAGHLFKVEDYTHRYPTCWRCKTELVWRVVDEWYISMDKKDNSGKTYREQMIEVAKKINWIPKWGLERELDWLKNMHDWLISKKRYWGLALPIWECRKCNKIKVIGSKEELKREAIEGWERFEGHSPHRPWVDEVKVKCANCDDVVSRIPDVGNPWLDAGIVPFSTMSPEWFPADFITEAFPGQFKNWFYSLIAMSTALKRTNPFKNLLGHALVRDEKGEEMHKSKGNAIEFNEAAEKIGVDVMRWMYVRQDPEQNLNFGYKVADEVRRQFHLLLWNIYNFFITYALVDKWDVKKGTVVAKASLLDRWILSRLSGTAKIVTSALERYEANIASRELEEFVHDLSLWYIRRSRDRVGPTNEDEADKQAFYETYYEVLVTLCRLLAPFIPFIADEMYTNLTSQQSVHLMSWPQVDYAYYNLRLQDDMRIAMQIASAVHAYRRASGIKVRIPLRILEYKGPKELSEDMKKIVLDEVNVYELVYRGKNKKYIVSGDTSQKNQDRVAGEAREIVRMIQAKRKELGVALDEKVVVTLLSWPKEHEKWIKRQVLAKELKLGKSFSIKR